MGTTVREFGIEVGFDGKWKKVNGGSKNLVVGVGLFVSLEHLMLISLHML